MRPACRTLPEYVCSVSHRVCTERWEQPAKPETDGRLAVTDAEELQIQGLREHYLTSLSRCRPLWLHPGGRPRFPSAVAEAWAVYDRIRGSLNCTVPEDRIRAVYPLLFGVPVDSHEELVSLVDCVASALQAEAPGSAAAVRARRHCEEITGATVVDSPAMTRRRCATEGGEVAAAAKARRSFFFWSMGGAGVNLRDALQRRRATDGGEIADPINAKGGQETRSSRMRQLTSIQSMQRPLRPAAVHPA